MMNQAAFDEQLKSLGAAVAEIDRLRAAFAAAEARATKAEQALATVYEWCVGDVPEHWRIDDNDLVSIANYIDTVRSA